VAKLDFGSKIERVHALPMGPHLQTQPKTIHVRLESIITQERIAPRADTRVSILIIVRQKKTGHAIQGARHM